MGCSPLPPPLFATIHHVSLLAVSIALISSPPKRFPVDIKRGPYPYSTVPYFVRAHLTISLLSFDFHPIKRKIDLHPE